MLGLLGAEVQPVEARQLVRVSKRVLEILILGSK